MPHIAYIIYLFAMGACVGSFLNVVVWRLPRGKSLITPPSHCPKCQTRLSWKDNIPIFGWIFLRGKCRYCSQPISARYPIIEFLCAAMFVGYYIAFYMLHIGPYYLAFQNGIAGLPGKHVPAFSQNIAAEWPTYVMSMWLLSSLLAASLIDAEMYIIPLQIPWICAVIGFTGHACFDRPDLPGHLINPPGSLQSLVGLGGGAGLIVSIILFIFRVIPQSFPQGEPAPEVDAIVREKLKNEPANDREQDPPPAMPPLQIRAEILKELLFILPALLGAIALIICKKTIPSFSSALETALGHDWLSGLAGASFGALVGAGLVWGARILGTLWFGRIAMGLGDVHLMFGIGAIVGASQSTLIFFGAPFMAIAVGIWGFITRKQRELPYGPYLSMAAALILLIHAPIEDYLRPGFTALLDAIRNIMGV